MSTSRWIQVDDTDPGISYTGSWFADNGSQNNLGNYGPPFQGTLHGTNSDGSFSYSFRGSRVLITGTVQYPYTSGAANPSWQCIIDGEAVGMLLYSTPQNRLRLCERDGMDASQLHTITVKVSVADQHTFWLDYVQYLPADSTTVNNAMVSIDTSDTAMQFNSASDWSAMTPGYTTSTAGASFTFQFQGVSILWLGFYDKRNAMKGTTATYFIDGGAATTFTLDGSGANGPGVLYNQIFFQSKQLSPGSHTLKVVHQGGPDLTPLSINTLVVQNGPGGSSSGGSGSGTTGVGSGTATSTSGSVAGGSGVPVVIGTSTKISSSTSLVVIAGTVDGTSTNLLTLYAGSSAGATSSAPSGASGSPSSVAATSPGTQSSPTNIGPIVGGVVGGLALILLAIFGFLLLRRRNRRDHQDHTTDAGIVQPFQFQPPMASRQLLLGNPSDPFSDQPIISSSDLQPLRDSKRPLPSPSSPQTNDTYTPSSEWATSPSRHGENSFVSNTQHSFSSRNIEYSQNTSTPPSSISTSGPLISPSVGVAVDEDSGLRFRRTMEGGQLVEVLPPVYSAA